MFNSSLDNTFKVGKNLAFELIGSIQTPMIQGTFDIETVYNLTAGLKWSFASDRINLSARCSDLFNSGMPNLKVRFNGQHLDMNNDFYSRSFTIHFSYRFGGYKKKEAVVTVINFIAQLFKSFVRIYKFHFLTALLIRCNAGFHPGVNFAYFEFPQPADFSGGHFSALDPVKNGITADAQIFHNFFH